MKPLREYQEKTVEFIKENARCAVTHSAGLGKSRCAIEAGRGLKTLVIAPAHLRIGWEREFEKWGATNPHKVVSYNYCIGKGNVERLLKEKFEYVIVDEITYTKNSRSKRTKAVIEELLPTIPRGVLMSATPIQKMATDIYPALTYFTKGSIGTYWDFANRYCRKVRNPWAAGGFKFEGVNQRTVGELRELWQKYAIKYRKEDVIKDLPEIVIEDLLLQAPGNTDNFVSAKALEMLEKGVITEEAKSIDRQVGLAKVDLVVDWMESADVEPTIIFVWHRDVGTALSKKLTELGIKNEVLLGGGKDTDRTRVMDLFKEGKLKTLVLSISAFSTGLNLPEARRIFFAEMPWTWIEWYQAYSRACRMDTAHTVFVHTAVLVGTMDEWKRKTIEAKKEYNTMISGEV